MRVVIDTNVWVSRLLLAGSAAAQAVDRALERFDVMVSEPLVEELTEVLSWGKFDRYVSVRDREEFLRRILQIAKIAPVLSEVDDCRDPDDNRLLALALDSESDCILTGDGDLLLLNPWRGVRIVSPREFLDIGQHDPPRPIA